MHAVSLKNTSSYPFYTDHFSYLPEKADDRAVVDGNKIHVSAGMAEVGKQIIRDAVDAQPARALSAELSDVALCKRLLNLLNRLLRPLCKVLICKRQAVLAKCEVTEVVHNFADIVDCIHDLWQAIAVSIDNLKMATVFL